MIRRIIQINEEKCTGCGLCATACHEGAIGIIDGKAKLLRDDYCDGLGDCLPACPEDAISFIEREALPYDEAAVKAKMAEKAKQVSGVKAVSHISNWPVQIKLVHPSMPLYNGADLLIAADCTAYAYGNFHEDFVRGRKMLIGCPKLDGVNYAERLTELFKNNDIKSILLTRMEVPCCGGMEYAINTAIANSGKEIPFEVVTISVDGEILK